MDSEGVAANWVSNLCRKPTNSQKKIFCLCKFFKIFLRKLSKLKCSLSYVQTAKQKQCGNVRPIADKGRFSSHEGGWRQFLAKLYRRQRSKEEEKILQKCRLCFAYLQKSMTCISFSPPILGFTERGMHLFQAAIHRASLFLWVGHCWWHRQHIVVDS